jgi:hypothetical protein
MDSVMERLVRTASAFRDANNRVRDRALRVRFEEETRVPFVCECGDPDCAATVMLTLAAYGEIRVNARRFLLLAGHDDLGCESVVDDETVHGYVVVEKFGEVGDEAAHLALSAA